MLPKKFDELTTEQQHRCVLSYYDGCEKQDILLGLMSQMKAYSIDLDDIKLWYDELDDDAREEIGMVDQDVEGWEW